MRILLACDKFKGTLTASEVSDVLGRRLTGRGHEIVALPIADGGDGTVAAAVASGFLPVDAVVTGPLGAPANATWARREDTAVIEMAQASGLAMVPNPDARTALHATSRGTGELMKAALDAGCTTLVLGIGGSATTDGGAGLLSALGIRFLDAHGQQIPDGGIGLESVAEVDFSDLDPRIESGEARVLLASDVDNPLLGPTGAPAIYGPQKGAGPAEVARLDAALARYAEVVPGGHDHVDRPGSGAAGGVGFGAFALLGAEGVPGADYVMDLVGFGSALTEVDLVVTGEGKLDLQTLNGKGPGRVVEEARAHGRPVYVVCGASDLPAGRVDDLGVSGIVAMADHAPLDQCFAQPRAVLDAAAKELAHLIG